MFSVVSGECDGDMSCVDAMDDISGTNLLGDLTFQATAGVTYYIMFDDRWLDTGFDFEVTVTPATCFYPTGFAFVDDSVTFTTASISWDEPATTPVGYQFEYGLAGFEAGSGTTLNPTTTQADMTNLVSGTDYEFYVRTNCGDGDYSDWNGPISFTTPFENANLNYAYGFETNNLNGWTSTTVSGSPWGVESAATLQGFVPQEGDNSILAGAFGEVSNSWLFSRGINVQANQVVNITYYVRKFTGAGAGGVNNIGLTIGTEPSVAGQTTVLTAPTVVTNTEWTQRTATYTATQAGVYYIAFNYTAAAQAQANFGWAALDNVTITSPTASADQFSAAAFSVSPNPANGIVTIANANALVNAVSVTDMNGRVVKTASFDGATQAQVNVSDLANGVYMMTISSDKGSVTKKIVKN